MTIRRKREEGEGRGGPSKIFVYIKIRITKEGFANFGVTYLLNSALWNWKSLKNQTPSFPLPVQWIAKPVIKRLLSQCCGAQSCATHTHTACKWGKTSDVVQEHVFLLFSNAMICAIKISLAYRNVDQARFFFGVKCKKNCDAIF